MKFDNKRIRHVAVYLRLSRDEEGKGIEKMLSNHKEILINLCKENNYSYEIFEEIASSSSIVNRPQMTRLLKRIQNLEFDAICVVDIDRLSRNEFDAIDIKRVLFETETLIVTPNKIYDTKSDEDSLLLGIQSLLASQEYKMIHKRMQRGKKYAQKQGHWTNGLPPLGFTKNTKTKKLEPNKDSKHIKFIFNSIIEGVTIPQIVEQLNSMGVKTRDNKPFHFVAIQRTIRNETYKGVIISNRDIGKHGKTKRPRDEWIIVENAHPSIVSEKDWSKANEIVNSYTFSRPRGNNIIYPTSKLIKCFNCGKTHSTQGYQRSTMLYYLKGCKWCKENKPFHYEPILKLIRNQIMEFKIKLLALIQEVESKPQGINTKYQLEQLNKNLKKNKNALNNIDVLFEEGEIDLKTYRLRKANRNEIIEQIMLEIEELEKTSNEDIVDNLYLTLEKVNALIGKWKFLEGEGLTDEEVNRLLHYLIDKIIWTYPKEAEEPIIDIFFKQQN